ncbi:Ig-like domain-containing protein [Mycobacterium sp. 852014-52144_SCH5372336]|uniref:Ig-like domain-containing protein n=1 Tax=Mycobacterium sp. 852014-52144_SCH5372336 TaxID=1834115 RepID=UPI0018D353F6|nr:Ig-like domain-containing protein [Mycobacterium sp. 852014-52144_SCH5372336]
MSRAPNPPASAATVSTARPRIVVEDKIDVVRQADGVSTEKPVAIGEVTSNRRAIRPVSVETATKPAVVTAAPPVVRTVSRFLAAVGAITPFDARTDDIPAAPNLLVAGLLHVIRREIDSNNRTLSSSGTAATVAPRSLVVAQASAVSAPEAIAASAAEPQPGDTTATPYGNIGKWMLKSNGSIANWGGQTYQGKSLLEPVNVVIVDPTSTTREESIQKLNAAMRASGFPARSPHSTGYYGVIDDITYGQQPSGFLQAYADNVSLTDHGRMFGPAPAANGQGYVWTGAFSTQGATHGYVSFNSASEELAQQLVNSGAATRLDNVYLGNAENSATQTTGDHTGYAVVLQLNASVPNQPPTAALTQSAPNSATGRVTGRVTAVDPERDKLTYSGMSTDKGTVTVTSTGAFTYTPTPTARHAAAAVNATEDMKTDTFVITVSDDFGNTTTVPVTVTVLGKNAAPTARATVGKADPLSGTVTGTIAVTDVDGDGITYTPINPESGEVTINPDGTFTYNPYGAARDLARAKNAIGTDTFKVTIDDGHGGVRTITVRTTIAPTDQAPVAGALDVGVPAAGNGSVKGSLTASDPDGDSFSFSGSTRTAKGYVTVSSRGTFTYVPTAAARRAAASATATDDDKFDTFTITVKDRFGATVTESVTVPILGF